MTTFFYCAECQTPWDGGKAAGIGPVCSKCGSDSMWNKDTYDLVTSLKTQLEECKAQLCKAQLDAPNYTVTRAILHVARERAKQLMMCGYSSEHDDAHTEGELAMLACYYTMPCFPDEAEALFPPEWPDSQMKRISQEHTNQVTFDDLVKGGALIVAEIDRRLRAGKPNG